MFRKNFLFGAASDSANVISVHKEDIYQPDKSFGFVVEENRRKQELLKVAELNSAFDTAYWYQDENLTVIEEDLKGCYVDSNAILASLEAKNEEVFLGEHRRIPFSFKVDLPRQGNYKIELTINAEEPMKDVLIFTGRRRLAFRGDIPAGKFRHVMVANVCDIVPRGQTRIYTDKTLDITILADKPRMSEILVEEIACPTIYIAGDSTVTDQSAEYPYAPGTSFCGWGQMISAYMSDRIAVSNHAHSGLTTDSFRKEGHYAIVDQYSKPGDFIFFQFGHNDQKLEELKARGGYATNLMNYFKECRDKGVYPVLVTPLCRNTWKGNDGTYNDLLEEYAEVCLEIGKVAEVPVLDLHKLSMNFILKNGLEDSKAYFYPNDYTHSNDYGAYLMAGYVASEIIRVCSKHSDPSYSFLAKCVTEGFGEWKITEQIVAAVKPKRFENLENPNAGAELLSEVKELGKPVSRVDALDMIIKTVRFFPTNVYNDMFVDVIGHEWFAGTVECAYQNGLIDDNMVEDKHFNPEKEVTLEEFLVFAMNGYQSRKNFPKEESCIYDSSCEKYAQPFVRAAFSIGLLASDGSDDLKHIITSGEAVKLCRKMGV